MPSAAIYVRERIEELRSRISLVESTLSAIEHDFWATFSSAMRSGQCPTLLYPTSTFNRLHHFVSGMKRGLRGVKADALPTPLLGQLDELNIESIEILTEIVRLQNVLTQRASGTAIDKLMEYKPTSQFEFCILSKSYDAVDALTYELVERLLGSAWMEREKYFPISLFDYSGYMINLYSYVISVPYHDSFRSRFWPSLAHEVGHIFTSYYSSLPGAFLEAIISGVDTLKPILGYGSSTEGDSPATNQLVELISDVVSAYVCPTSFLSAASLIGVPFELPNAPNGALARFFRDKAHPPLDSRLASMRTVLSLTGCLSQDPDFENYTRNILEFLERKNIFGLTPSSHEFIENYNSFAMTFSKDIVDILPRMGVKGFTGVEWKTVSAAIHNRTLGNLSPIQLLNLAWTKRLKTIKNDDQLELKDYFDARAKEGKAFETVIDSMHKYYEKEIVTKMETNWHDLRNRSYEG